MKQFPRAPERLDQAAPPNAWCFFHQFREWWNQQALPGLKQVPCATTRHTLNVDSAPMAALAFAVTAALKQYWS